MNGVGTWNPGSLIHNRHSLWLNVIGGQTTRCVAVQRTNRVCVFVDLPLIFPNADFRVWRCQADTRLVDMFNCNDIKAASSSV